MYVINIYNWTKCTDEEGNHVEKKYFIIFDLCYP